MEETTGDTCCEDKYTPHVFIFKTKTIICDGPQIKGAGGHRHGPPHGLEQKHGTRTGDHRTTQLSSRGPMPTKMSQGGQNYLPPTYLKETPGREITISTEDLWKQAPT